MRGIAFEKGNQVCEWFRYGVVVVLMMVVSSNSVRIPHPCKVSTLATDTWILDAITASPRIKPSKRFGVAGR